MRYSLLKPLKNGLAKFFIISISRLPLSMTLVLGTLLGRLMYISNNRSKRITSTNLKICFPNNNPQAHQQLLKESLIEDSKVLLEALWLWKNANYAVNNLIGNVENEYLLEETKKEDQSTIIVTPHFGSWEFAGIYSAYKRTFRIMYAPAKIPYIEKLSRQGRTSTGATLQKTDANQLRSLISYIKKGGNLGVLPDQVPAHNAGVFAPFFKRDAYTSTLIHKLVSKHNCKVIVGYALRSKTKPWVYNMHYYSAPKGFYTSDPKTSARVLNEFIEECINKSPANYLWSYKRFKRAGPNDTAPY